MSNEKNGREVILSVKHVDISFEVGHKKKFDAVKDANFDIYKGETFALVGESGSGKTTLGRAILRINPCSAGEILFEGKRISGKISHEEDRNVVRNIQMIFQDPAASLNERATIEYCVSEGLYNFHLYKDEADRIAVIHRGEIVEIAESETLFEYPIHPYTVSLLSTVPMPDPIVEKSRKHIVYDPSQLDQSGEKRELKELRPGHFVLANSKEFAAYEEKITRLEKERAGR